MCVKNKSNNLLDSNRSTNFNKKSYFKAFVYVLYDTYNFTIRYDTIHMIRILYRTIYEHLRYADMIRNFLHTIRYVSYDTYRESYDANNYV